MSDKERWTFVTSDGLIMLCERVPAEFPQLVSTIRMTCVGRKGDERFKKEWQELRSQLRERYPTLSLDD